MQTARWRIEVLAKYQAPIATEHTRRATEDTSHARLQTDPAAVRRYQQMRFGLFVHWGIYALIGHGEWAMHTEKIPVEEYQRPPPPFNPVHVNADEWAQLMLDTGQRHLTGIQQTPRWF
jgi:hypothetical protein